MRRLREMCARQSEPLLDERGSKSQKLDELDDQLDVLAGETDKTSGMIREIVKQSRLGSYKRVSLGPRK